MDYEITWGANNTFGLWCDTCFLYGKVMGGTVTAREIAKAVEMLGDCPHCVVRY